VAHNNDKLAGRTPMLWHVIFCDSAFNLYLKPGFRHVWMLGYQAYTETWSLVDWHGTKCDLLTITKEARDMAIGSLSADSTHLAVVEELHSEPKLTISVYSCVTIVKRILGLRAPMVFTPLQLYNYMLTKARCRVIKSGDISNENVWWGQQARHFAHRATARTDRKARGRYSSERTRARCS